MILFRFACQRLQLTVFFIGLGICWLGDPLHGQPARNDSTPRQWILNFKKGDVGLHRGKTTITGRSADGKTETHLVIMPTEKVEIKDVNAKGEAIIVDTPVALEVTDNGKTQRMEGAAFTSTTIVINKLGLVQKDDGDTEASSPLNAVQSLLSNMPTPAAAVKVGESWKTELENRLVPGKKVVMNSTFLGIEQQYGIETFKTRFTVSLPTGPNATDDQTVKAEGIRNIDVKTGRLVRSEVKIQNVEYITPHGVVKGSVEMSNYLIVPGINDGGKIVGTGLYQGQSRAFELDPLIQGVLAPTSVPEPGSIALIGLGLTLLATRRVVMLQARRDL